jgi:glutamine synthetase
VPDPATLVTYLEPSGRGRRARFSCSVRRRDGQPFAGDPRSVLERNLEEARAAGFDFRVALEMEYYLFPRDDRDGMPPTDAAGYFGTGPGLGTGTRDDVVASLAAMGIHVGGAHHETGPGQEELDLLPGSALRMADTVLTVREVIRAVAERHGLRASLMPKPLSDAPGSGMHVFQRLHRVADGGDALRGEGETISLQAKHAIAGQLAHARGMCAVVCPTVNSYKRLAAGHRAPRHATWARLSQASLIRVPSWAPSADSTVELELRSPDNMANPYLTLAIALASAMDGIRREQEPPLALDENLVRYDDDELARLGVPSLPHTLGDALTALAEDDVVRTALGDYVCDQFLLVKRAEWNDYRRYVSPWERERYGD